MATPSAWAPPRRLAINPATYKSLPFDVLDDLAPIGNIAAVPNIMSVHPAVKAAPWRSSLRWRNRSRASLSYASPGFGSVGHLLGEQFKLATGTDILHVPYRGMGPALNDAIGGQVQVIYDNLPTSLELVKSGKLRGLGLSGEKRVAELPDVPTFGELRLDDINWMAFFGLIAPKDTPAPIVRRLNEALVRVLATPDMRDKLAAQQAIVVGNSPGGLQGRDRPRAGALQARRRGGEDRAELASPPGVGHCALALASRDRRGRVGPAAILAVAVAMAIGAGVEHTEVAGLRARAGRLDAD